MALESFAFNVAQKVLEKLASKAYQEISVAWGVQGELKKLEDVLMTVKAVLLDAEEKQVGRFFSSSNPLAFSFKMGHKIKQIREQLDEIASHKAKFHLNERDEGRRSMPKERAMTHSFVNVSDIIGRDNDKENIIRLLQKPNDGGKIDVIPIVGIGGLGKTALSKLVYNDKRVQNHFQLKMWVCVSEDFDIKNLIEKIIKCATSDGENRSNLEVEQLQKILREKIGDKKYFLILDDVWNEDSMRWDQLQELLVTGANGSKILVTTRSKKVASIMSTISEPYELSGLPHDKCMALFTKCAFKEGEEKHYPNLLKIGDKIVEKCKGVPLAVKTLASLLLTNKDESYWKFIRDSELWKIEQKENDKILPALRLSYEQLPACLKKCFAYCSFYPKDSECTSFSLIQFWMAHGLLESTNENEDLEDIAWRYFQELGSRSFLQDFEDCDWFIKCKMHDLVHDLALSLTQNEFSTITSTTTHISKSVRHLLFPDFTSLPQGLSTRLQDLEHVRTALFMRTEEISQSALDLCLSRFHYLRMLDLSESKLEVPLERIGSLKHLRLLFLPEIKKVPNSICKLQNLQSLLLRTEELPNDIRLSFGGKMCWVSIWLRLGDLPFAMKENKGRLSPNVIMTGNVLLNGKQRSIGCRKIPSSFVFDLFDDLCLLSSGETIYFGEAKAAIKFFSQAGFPCPTRRNPSDHFLRDLLNLQILNQSEHRRYQMVLIQKYMNSAYSVDTRKRIRELTLVHEELVTGPYMNKASWWKQLCILTNRSFINMTRDLAYYWIRILFCVLIALGAGIMFFDIGLSSSAILARVKCYTYFFDFLLCLCVGGLPSLSEEWKVVYYERYNGHYGEGVFVLANFLSSLPFLVIISLSSGIIIYYMVKFHLGFSIYCYFCINLFCCVAIMESITMIVALLVPYFLMGIGITAAVIMLLTIAAGLYRQLAYLPKFFWQYQ
ncbi:hypothetical protein GH714_034035 [Hevea brasiliensis]|uniref:NB-ARC domain-containing protein n=1 Tax=Hevea brasiliensis TaxID=3981 RepID=A0A6A6M7S4_HEVBR|nr:hypothetical protein GH714_034035 [Hevea brasiliensis]